MSADTNEASNVPELLDPSTLPKYQWQPLQSIDHRRLIHILPAENLEDPIVISISEYAPDQIPRYLALSYHWGDPAPKHDIVVLSDLPVSHQSDESKLSWRAKLGKKANLRRITIHHNLMVALRRLRSQRKTVIYWTDSLCINQTDNTEKVVQIQRMSRVYSGAYHVVVFLGEHDSELDEIMFKGVIAKFDQHLQTMNLNDRELSDSARLIATIHHQWDQELNLSPPLSTTTVTYTALQSLFGRPWFERVWVVQEACRAPHDPVQASFVIGSLALPSTLVRQFRLVATSLTMNGLLDGHKPFPNTPVLILDAGGVAKLIDLLEYSQAMCASDPRDHCYGVLAKSEFAMSAELRPNYDEPISSTFIRYSRFLIPQYGPRILSCCVKAPNDPLVLPSWVPNWSSSTHVLQPVGQYSFYMAGGLVQHAYQLFQGEILRAPGIVLGQISVKTYVDSDLVLQRPLSPSRDRSDPRDLRLRIVIILCLALIQLKKAVSDVGLSHTVAYRYLTSEYLGADSEETQCLALFLALFSSLQAGTIPDVAKMAAHISDPIMEDLIAMGAMSSNVYMCITQTGFLAKVPNNFEDDDVIGMAQGCNFPLLLRPVSEEESAQYAVNGKLYRIVGYAYVDGLMHGEAFADDQNKVEDLFFI